MKPVNLNNKLIGKINFKLDHINFEEFGYIQSYSYWKNCIAIKSHDERFSQTALDSLFDIYLQFNINYSSYCSDFVPSLFFFSTLSHPYLTSITDQEIGVNAFELLNEHWLRNHNVSIYEKHLLELEMDLANE